MQGAIWVLFTQTLICNDKINDGAYFAIETNFPEGTLANLGDAAGSTSIAWAFLQPRSPASPRAISRALQSRGFIEEMLSTYSVSGNVPRAAASTSTGSPRLHELRDLRARAWGRSTSSTALDYCAAVFNPEGDMGDVEMWELI